MVSESMALNPKELVQRMLRGDRVALSRAITLVESGSPPGREILLHCADAPGRAYSVGITGPPGAGKSTILNQLIKLLRRREKKIGIIAIDPTSAFTGGALLGDRIRMLEHASDEEVFIRSLGTRGATGGISRSTGDIMRLYDKFGMDYTIIETVGVGQTELEVVELADTIVVVLVPEAGDEVQAMKAGLLEIGDIFVVNKADRGGAERMVREIEQSQGTGGGEAAGERETPVIAAEAHVGKGMEALLEAIERNRGLRGNKRAPARESRDRLERELSLALGEALLERLESRGGSQTIAEVLGRVRAGEITPREGARILAQTLDQILDQILERKEP